VRPPADDQPRPVGRLRELGLDDRVHGEVADRAVPVPALVAGLGDEPPRPRPRRELAPLLEAADPQDSVARAAETLGGEEVVGQDVRVAVVEAERRQARSRLLRRQAAACA
jgi:hypothetical protein